MKLVEWLSVLLTPACWIQGSDAYSRAWDEECRRLLRENVPVIARSDYEAQWGPYHVWIANHPYGSFTLYRSDETDGISRNIKSLRPSRFVILRAGALMKKPHTDAELEMAAFIAGKQGLKSSSRAVERAAGNL